MKTKKNKMKYSVAAVAVALALTGCERPQRADSAAPSTNASARAVKKEIKEAAEATRSYAVESKDQFVAATQEKLNKLDLQIAELSARTETLKDEAKAESNKALATLREQRAQLGQKFDELKKSSKEAWKEVKAGFESAFAELEKAYQDAKSKFSG